MKRISGVSDSVIRSKIIENNPLEYYGEYEFIWASNSLGYLKI